MAKNKEVSAPPPEANARIVTSAEDKIKAGKWFSRARELGEKKQFDYAIEYYVNGLEFWPDAVEEACRPLHGCALARRQTGGKKPGLKDTMTRSMTDKDPKKALMNSFWLFGREPDNLNYVEGIAKAASRLRADDTAKWATGVFYKGLESSPKPSPKQFESLVQLCDEIGDRASARGEVQFGVEIYQMGIDAINTWRRKIPKDQSVDARVKNLSTKLTILRGKYQDAGSYRDSILDIDEQKDRHDEQRSVQTDERFDELVAKAEKTYRDNPEEAGALKRYIDLLCRRERTDEEIQAIGILVTEFKRSSDYRWKIVADDIRIKQLARRTRELVADGEEEKIKEHRISQLRFELKVFKERLDRYPTDNRIRFEYGVRCFNAGRYDDAIPLFQGARTDPKNRAACGMYLGRCFLRKGYHDQSISAFQEALEGYETPDDDFGKTTLYWFGRAEEDAGRIEAAKGTYGRLLQMDYTFKDVRTRLDALSTRA